MSGPRPARRRRQTDRRQGAVVAVLAISSFVVVLDYAGVVILLPAILDDLGGGLDGISWVLAALLLPFVVLLLPAFRVVDRVGPGPVLIVGLSLFVLGSVAAGLSTSIPALLTARVVQGCGAACSEAAVAVLVRRTRRQSGTDRARDAQRGAFFLAAALGPVLPGAIATGLSWEYFFWINAALTAGLLVAAVLCLPVSGVANRSRPLDLPGTLAGGAGLVLLFLGLIEGPRLGWASPGAVLALVAAPACFGVFVVVERRSGDPLVRPSLFAARRYAVGNVLRAATEFTSLGIFLPLSHFLQAGLGHSALIAGLILTAVIVGAVFSAAVTEPLVERVDVRCLVVPGFLAVTAGTLWLAHVSPMSSWWSFLGPLAVVGVGIGALEGPTEDASARDVPRTQADAAERVSYATYLLGIGLGVAVVSAVWQTSASLGAATAVNHALVTCGVVAALGAGGAMFLTSDPVPRD